MQDKYGAFPIPVACLCCSPHHFHPSSMIDHSQTCLPACLIWKGEAQQSSHNVQTCGHENWRVGVPNVCGNDRRHQATNPIDAAAKPVPVPRWMLGITSGV